VGKHCRNEPDHYAPLPGRAPPLRGRGASFHFTLPLRGEEKA